MQSLASVKAHFSHVIDEVAGTHERVTVTRNGSPLPVILAVEDFESLVETAGARCLSLMWLDSRGRMVARVLSLDGIALRATPDVLAVVWQIHAVFVEHAEVSDGHLAFAISRPGEIETTDDTWAVALRTAMDLALNVAAIRQRYERTDPQASGARPGNEGRGPN